MNPPPPNLDGSGRPTRAPSTGELSLCGMLWFAALGLTVTGAFLLLRGQPAYGALALAIAGLCTAAGWGIFRRRRWGAALFGALGMLGSANHLATILNRHNDLSRFGIGALVSLLAAILIPAGVIYLTLSLWRQFKVR